MLAEFEKRVAFAALHLFEIENIVVKRDRVFDIAHLNRDVIASVNLHAHDVTYAASRIFVGLVLSLAK